MSITNLSLGEENKRFPGTAPRRLKRAPRRFQDDPRGPQDIQDVMITQSPPPWPQVSFWYALVMKQNEKS